MPALSLFGLDIGTSFTKIVQLTKNGEKFDLITSGSIVSPSRALLSESLEDQQTLADTIKKLLEEAKPTTHNVVAALPESQIFTRVIEMPTLSETELSSAIKWEAEQYVPMPLSEVQVDWQILDQIKAGDKVGKVEVLLVAAPKILIEKYLKILALTELVPVALETEPIALSRSLMGAHNSNLTTLIISIGSSNTDISIIRQGKLTFTRSIGTGGIALSRAVAQDLGFEFNQAEEYKKTYGLDANQLEGKVMQSIKPVFDLVVNEIRRALAYYIGKRPEDPVKRAIITGGNAVMPGMVVYLANALGLEVLIGNPWESINVLPSFQKNLFAQSASYGASVGLAMREENG